MVEPCPINRFEVTGVNLSDVDAPHLSTECLSNRDDLHPGLPRFRSRFAARELAVSFYINPAVSTSQSGVSIDPLGASGLQCFRPVNTENDSKLPDNKPFTRGAVLMAAPKVSSVTTFPLLPRRLLHTRVQPPPSVAMSQ